MNMLKNQKLILGFTFLFTIYQSFAQLPSNDQEEEPLSAPIDEFIVPMVFIAILIAGYFFRLQNKELKKV